MIKTKNLMNENIILRLSKYKNALTQFKRMGFIKIFSDNLADYIGVSPALVRKDFSMFGLTGQKKGGYFIDALLEKIHHILGKDQIHHVILAGVGKLGAALLHYPGFEKEEMKIVAAFDIDPEKVKVSHVPIYPIDILPKFAKKYTIKTGIICTPAVAAQQVADMMIQSGIKGILNFAPVNIKEPEGIVIKNVDIAIFLENVIYFVNAIEKA